MSWRAVWIWLQCPFEIIVLALDKLTSDGSEWAWMMSTDAGFPFLWKTPQCSLSRCMDLEWVMDMIHCINHDLSLNPLPLILAPLQLFISQLGLIGRWNGIVDYYPRNATCLVTESYLCHWFIIFSPLFQGNEVTLPMELCSTCEYNIFLSTQYSTSTVYN